MISVVLYGRNANYGSNLYKRAALSLNCTAELLTDPSDEILFVDYNTPDDLPTLPEAIHDTLTERTRDLLRVLRVRSRIHDRFKSKTPLMVLESVARNVAVRRSSQSSRWILSTNTNMIPIPLRGDSMTEVVRTLPGGIYRAPRIEIAQPVWESFDRKAADDVIHRVRQWGGTLQPTDPAATAEDFQLILRNDLFENHGFDEGMLFEHCVGANIARRMYLKYGAVGDLGGEIRGYHCDHTRQATPAPGHETVENDWRRVVDEIDRADIPAQAQTWGCAGDTIEELCLNAKSAGSYVQALREAIGEPLAEPKIVDRAVRAYNKADYDPRHLLPFLADMFVSMPRRTHVAWYGARMETLRLFAIVWDRLGFTGNILVDRPIDDAPHLTSAVRYVPSPDALTEADTFVFDFGGLPVGAHDLGTRDNPDRELLESFRRVVREERASLASGLPLRRIIALNAINNLYEAFVLRFVAAVLSPFATHIRHGFVLPAAPLTRDWLPLLTIGEAGIRTGREIRTDPQRTGVVAYGAYQNLDEGTYRLAMEFKPLAHGFDGSRDTPCVIVEVLWGAELLGVCCFRQGDLQIADHRFLFDVPPEIVDRPDGVEMRVRSVWPAEIVIRTLTVEPAAESTDHGDQSCTAAVHSPLQVTNWLPFLYLGPLGRIDDLGAYARIGPPEFVVFGPYWSLPAGKYEMVAEIEPSLAQDSSGRHRRPIIKADVVADDGRYLLAESIWRVTEFQGARSTREFRLPFELTGDLPVEARTIETRLWSPGDTAFRIVSLAVRLKGDQCERNWLSYLADKARQVAARLILRRRIILKRLTRVDIRSATFA